MEQLTPAPPSKFTDKLVSPFPILPVQVKGVYMKALLDSSDLELPQLLWQTLEAPVLRKLEDLEIWGMGTNRPPCDGYLPVKREFSHSTSIWFKSRRPQLNKWESYKSWTWQKSSYSHVKSRVCGLQSNLIGINLILKQFLRANYRVKILVWNWSQNSF